MSRTIISGQMMEVPLPELPSFKTSVHRGRITFHRKVYRASRWVHGTLQGVCDTSSPRYRWINFRYSCRLCTFVAACSCVSTVLDMISCSWDVPLTCISITQQYVVWIVRHASPSPISVCVTVYSDCSKTFTANIWYGITQEYSPCRDCNW
jgi:hypothetical protein